MSNYQSEEFCPNCKKIVAMNWLDMDFDGYKIVCTNCPYFAWENAWKQDVKYVNESKPSEVEE